MKIVGQLFLTNRWFFKYLDDNGALQEITFTSEEEAENFQRKVDASNKECCGGKEQ